MIGDAAIFLTWALGDSEMLQDTEFANLNVRQSVYPSNSATERVVKNKGFTVHLRLRSSSQSLCNYQCPLSFHCLF